MTTPSERESARKEILDMLGVLQKNCGPKYTRADMLTRFTRKAFTEMFALADELRARLDMLEEQALNYRGIFERGAQYSSGDLVTFRSGLWHANATTKDTPGTSNNWRLMSKTLTAKRGEKS